MKRLSLFVALVLILVFVVGCGKKEENVINIGAILSLTGAGAEYGQEQEKAIKLFKDELKTKDTRNRYNIVIQDSKSSPKDAVNALQYIRTQGELHVVMTVLSSVSMALKPITEENKIPLFCVGANPNITKEAEFVFRSLPTSEYQTKTLAKEFISKNSDLSNFAVLYVNDDMGVGSRDSFMEVIESGGKNVLLTEAISLSSNDYRAAISKIIANSPDAIFVASYGNSLATALIQLRELNYNGIILSPLEVSYPRVLERAGNAAENVIFVDTDYTIGEREVKFIDLFENMYGQLPNLDAILAYDELNLIVNIIEENGPNPENFQKIKGKAIEYVSPIGKFKVNELGDFLYPLVLKKIVNSKPIVIE